MYYKVIKNDEVVDVLNHILYIKYQEKHSLLLLCDITEAPGYFKFRRKIWMAH